MSDPLETIQACQQQVESALAELEDRGLLGEALVAYEAAENKLIKLGLLPFHREFRQAQRVLAGCLLRQVAILSQFGRLEQALETSERLLAAARAAGERRTLAQALDSFGRTCLAIGDQETGEHARQEAQRLLDTLESE